MAWVAVRALIAKENLESAQETLRSATEGEGRSASELIRSIAGDAASAAAVSADPIWRAAEFLPMAGDNLRAVRLAAEALDIGVGKVGEPILAMQEDGQGKILARALPYIAEGAEALRPVSAELIALSDSGSLIPQVRSGVDKVTEVLQAAEPLLEHVPRLLGADGPQNILLVFQNNAESLPLGGSAASQTLITADHGDLVIAKQAGSGDFRWKKLTGYEVEPSAAALYGSTYGERVNMSVTRPDWPSSARMLTAFWNRDIDDTRIDAVVSIDPIALQRLLKATGPLKVAGKTIDSTNAVKTLLSDVYVWWDAYSKKGAKASDAFFAAVAATMFEKVASGGFDVAEMGKQVRTSIEKGDIMMWSADDELEEYLASTRIGGVLPTDNISTTTVGIYYRDVSASKIDYYLKTSATATLTCAGETTTLTAKTTLNLNISKKDAAELPRYVQSFRRGSDFFSKHVFIYAPPGMKIAGVEVDGRDVSEFRKGNVDLGREVAAFQMTLRPRETASVTATFVGNGAFGPLEVRTTPMINPTKVTVKDRCD